MTNEEIIKKIDMMIAQEGTLGESSKMGKDFYIKNIEALKIVKQAVEKQIPKKPTHYDSIPHDRCPNCHNAVKVFCDAHEYHYCLYCGQALDWSDIE